MNTKIAFYLTILTLAVFTVSCRKEWNNKTPENQLGTQNLNVPSGFDWSASRDVTIEGSYLTASTVKITSPDEKTIFYTGTGDGKPVTVNVPFFYNQVYVNGTPFNISNLKSQSGLVATKMNFPANSNRINNSVNNQAQEFPGNESAQTFAASFIDTDGDGVLDVDDAYPNDPLRAYNNYFPAAGFGSLAFEDLWPGIGDYDFNDLVVDYRFQVVTNAVNNVVEVYGHFASKAAGATLNNGFGFSLPDISPDLSSNPANLQVSGMEINENYISLNAQGLENGQSKPTFIVHDNIFNLLAQPGGGTGANTTDWAASVDYDTTVLLIVPSGGNYVMADFGLTTWNPFLIVDGQRGHEVHLPGYATTDLANQALFATFEDDSDPLNGRTYLSHRNLPWAINLPSSFAWPKEKVDITRAYLKFAEWVESGGLLYPDWYLDEPGYRDSDLIYNN
jgi:LruC domain-containing protein